MMEQNKQKNEIKRVFCFGLGLVLGLEFGFFISPQIVELEILGFRTGGKKARQNF